MATGFNSIGHGENAEKVIDATIVLPTIEERRKAASDRLDQVEAYLAKRKRARGLAETMIVSNGSVEAAEEQPLPQLTDEEALLREKARSTLEGNN